MAAKDFSFRGKTLEELQALEVNELLPLLTSRARRSLKRGFNKKLLQKVDRALGMKKAGKDPKPIRTHLRQFIILPKMVGLRFAIHKGNTFEITEISPEMIGGYLGEYQLTRKRVTHGKAGIGATKSSSAITAK
ncbi:MAG: 30S ribosomal protein S19 [Candidatus Diapherotrites archaeon]|nr:30S ribosomal protein S19 [Candidatus Diapherotrites archaeon]